MLTLPEKLKSKAKKISSYLMWLLMFFFVTSIIKNVGNIRNIHSQVQLEADKVQKMKEENAQIEDQIALAQGSDFIEKQIRDKLGLTKPGETIVVLPDEDTLKKLAPKPAEETGTLPDPTWKKWEKLFF